MEGVAPFGPLHYYFLSSLLSSLELSDTRSMSLKYEPLPPTYACVHVCIIERERERESEREREREIARKRERERDRER